MTDTPEPKFEDALSRLEELVAKLESGQLSLEESMAAFEEGMKLGKLCGAKLSAAEKKIEQLMKNADGENSWQPLNPNPEGN